MNNKHYMLLATIVLVLSSFCCSSYAEDSFPLIKKIIEYATYLDKVSTPVFDAIYTGEKTSLTMTDEEFEKFMLGSTEMKVGIMNMITESMIQIASLDNKSN